MNREERGPWYLLTGLVLGIALGLGYAWWVQPVEYVNTTPASLRQEFKDQYRALIAAAYLGNTDLVRARARLELLQDADIFRALSGQAQRTLANAGEGSEAQALGLLAIALGQAPPGPAVAITQERAAATQPGPAGAALTAPAVETGEAGASTAAAQALGEPSRSEPTAGEPATGFPASKTAQDTASPETAVLESTAPLPSRTPAPARPTATLPATAAPEPGASLRPSLTPGGPFLLLSREKVCDQKLSAPLIQIEALDRFNQPMPGVLVTLSWQGGEERFYTGLKPEKGPGYAAFSPAPGVLYTLRLGEAGQPEDNLAALVCVSSGGERTWGAWLLKFVQP